MSIIDDFLRWRTGRGFGVQSPSAYSFIRYVVKESYPYYFYSVLAKEYPDLCKNDISRLKLYFRISNFWQPRYAFLENGSEALKNYLKCGCNKMTISDTLEYSISAQQNSLYILKCTDDILDRITNIAKKNTLLILEGINNSIGWNKLVKSPSAIRTYDLKDIGIVFFDDRKLNEHFRLSY